MANVWDFFNNFFREAEQSSASNPLVHKMLERTPEEKAAYLAWKGSMQFRRLTDWLSNQYGVWLVLPDDIDEAIDFLNTPSSKGFAIHFFKTDYGREDVTHFFDFLWEKVLTLNYKTQISDSRTWSQQNWVQTVERHYLKPRPDWASDKKINQQYGNITIELTLRNEQPHDLKFRATSYRDHLYAKPHDFKDLMQSVLLQDGL